MLSLLKWKTFSGNLGEILNNFTYVEQTDVIKVWKSKKKDQTYKWPFQFLHEVFDALFAILDSKQGVAILV